MEDVKIKELKGGIVINGENFLAQVRDQFNKQTVGSFLTNKSMCQSDSARSHAVVTHLVDQESCRVELSRYN